MVSLQIKVEVTEDRQVTIKLPDDFPLGEVEITIAAEKDGNASTILGAEPLTGAEIVARGLTGGWEDIGIADSVAWVEEQKRKRRERHKWPLD